MELVTVLVVVALSLGSVWGEVELVCPSPVDTTSSLVTYTELYPGPRTIVFRETRAIAGSPFRISIIRNGVECVILDHIPWQRENKMYYVTVNIPEMNCDQMNDMCELVVRQFDTASSNGYCTFDKCNKYNSTTAILIKRNAGAVGCPSRRTNYNMYNWPYDPVNRYTSNNIRSTLSPARGISTYLLIGNTIIYTLNVTVPFSDDLQPQTVRFVYYPSGSTDAVILSTVTFPTGELGVLGSWIDVSDFNAYILRNTTMYVQVIASEADDGMIEGQIVQAGANGIDDIYGLEYGMYASSGWLAGDVFVGPGANATLFTKPHGPCTMNSTRYFGCMLSGSSRSGGTVAMSLTGNRLWFSMDMFNLSSAINSVVISGATIDDLDLTPFWSNGYRLRGLTDVTDDTQVFITSGSASVSISTTSNRGELSCSLEEGIISILDSSYEVPAINTDTLNGSATAFLSFSYNGEVNYQITLNSLSSPLTAGHIHGPAYQGISTGNIPLDISEFITGEMDGGWNIQGTWRNLSANELRYFVENLYYLNMHTSVNPAGELRGQVSAIGDWVCPSRDLQINQCYWLNFDVVSGVNFGNGRTPGGVGSVVVDRYQRLQYSLALWYIPENEQLTVVLSSAEGNLITTPANDQSDIRSNVREVYGSYPNSFDLLIPDIELERIRNGEVWFNVTSTSYPSGLMNTYLPPLTRSMCPGMPFNVTVGGENGWAPTGSNYPSMRVLEGDMLMFTFTSPDDLYEMANKNRLAGCVFTPSTATLLADAQTVDPNTYYYLLALNPEKENYNYFSSLASCQNQNMRLTTYTVGSVASSDRLDTATCSRSLYSYSEDQRSSSSSGSLAGAITATIIAVVVGIVIAAVAIVMGVYFMMKHKRLA